MRTLSMKFGRIFLVIALALPATACAQSTEIKSAKEGISLFDGQSLDGWTVTEENPQSFKVENGAIVAHGPRAHLFYTGSAGTDFQDFELNLQVKTQKGSNSGVFFHTRYQVDDWPKYGLEAQINATQGDPRKTGSIYSVADLRVYDDEAPRPTLGFDYNAYAVVGELPHSDAEWFNYRVRVEGQTVNTYVNDKLLVSWTQAENWADPTRRLSSGTFALQAHDTDSIVYFKNIRVTHLSEVD
jgi:hypothetical protein